MLQQWLESWGSLYANHSALRTAVEFMHVGGLVASGGCAVAADRAALMVSRRDPAARAEPLRQLQSTHGIVVVGLVVVIASGVLLLGADLDMYLYSKMFWLKMGLMVLLLLNGTVLLRAERDVARGNDRAWSRLTYAAVASLTLWFLTTLAGAALPNIG